LDYYGSLPVGRDVNITETLKLTSRDFPSVRTSDARDLRTLLGVIRRRYGNVSVSVTGNGAWDSSGDVADSFRSSFITSHLDEVLKAVRIDGSNVKAYTYRSLADGFEWSLGYQVKFGLVKVNFTEPGQPRSLRNSAHVFRKIALDNGILRDTVK
ncbi:unnamed protein product, partial [Lymnaea stagnalis]